MSGAVERKERNRSEVRGLRDEPSRCVAIATRVRVALLGMRRDAKTTYNAVAYVGYSLARYGEAVTS